MLTADDPRIYATSRRPPRPRGTRAALAAVERLADEGAPTQEVVEEIARRVTSVIAADAFFVGAIDPDTGQCLGAAIHHIDEDVRVPYWEHELLVPDYNRFADLTSSEPVGDLREATGGDLRRSARYRLINRLAGFEDELRATLTAGGRAWGNLQLNRRAGEEPEPFAEADRAFLRELAPVAGRALRRALLFDPIDSEPSRGPGVVMIDASGAMTSATPEGEAWLHELIGGPQDAGFIGIEAELLLMPLTARASDGDGRPRRVRLRTLRGRWLIAHASPLGAAGETAVVIEPATPSEVVAIVVEAYGLTGREVEVTRRVARGLGTEEIAAELFLSRHTVRDHLKAVFEKVGVSSRGALTFKLFAAGDPGQAPAGGVIPALPAGTAAA